MNKINTSKAVLEHTQETQRRDELKELAAAFTMDFPHMSRAVGYLNSLDPARHGPRGPIKSFPFIDAGPTAVERVGQVQLGARPLPPKPHHLQVVFHRA